MTQKPIKEYLFSPEGELAQKIVTAILDNLLLDPDVMNGIVSQIPLDYKVNGEEEVCINDIAKQWTLERIYELTIETPPPTDVHPAPAYTDPVFGTTPG